MIPIKPLFKSIRKRVVFELLSVPIVILALSMYGCGPAAGYFNVLPNDTEPGNTIKTDSLPNGSIINISEYGLKQSHQIDQLEYDYPLNILLIKYSEGEDNNYLQMLDLNENKTLWKAKSNMSVSMLKKDNLLLKDPSTEKLYNATKGVFVRDIEKFLYLTDEGITLQLSPDKFARIDLQTGKIYWEGPGAEWEGYREVYIDGDWCYVVAEGLHGIKLDEGKKWEYLTATSFTNTGKEIARQVALSCLAGLTGGYNTSAYNPDVTMNMNSQPMIVGNDIFFAARDKIACLDRFSGKVIWESEIDPELESMHLYDVSDNEIALVGEGTKILNYILQKSDPPTIRLIQKKDGKITSLYTMDEDNVVQSFLSTDGNMFLLTPNQLLMFNMDLKLISAAETKFEYGDFINILSAADTIILRTSKGLLGLSRESFSEVFFRYCELPPVEANDQWRIPVLEKIKIKNQSMFADGYYFTPNENYGVSAFDMNNWQEVTKIPLLGKNMTILDGNYFDFLNNRVKIISF